MAFGAMDAAMIAANPVLGAQYVGANKSGLLKDVFKQKAGIDSGNALAGSVGQAQGALNAAMTRDPQAARNELMADPTLAKYFTQDAEALRGDIGNIRGEERDLATRGYGLTQDDKEAYGQASGDIARQFGRAEGGLSQALAARGLSNSGSANRAFMGSQGNKLEQLAGLQRKIADDRVKTNLARLNSTRQFQSQLMGQQANQMGQYTGELGRRDTFALGKGQLGLGTLTGSNEQANQNFAQQQATKGPSMFQKALGGAVSGAAGGFMSGGPMGAAAGGGLGAAGGALGADQGTNTAVGYSGGQRYGSR